jgi:pyruvate formate lyase activating enzyme
LAGCNFRCPFCHAGHLVVSPNTLESIPFERLRAYWAEHGGWIDGVTISGGEPTICDRLEALIDAVKDAGLDVKLDTNGSRPDVLESLIERGRIDAVSMDIKAPMDERYSELAGAEVDLEAIRRSIDILLSGAVGEYEFRTTLVPGMLGGEAAVEIARSIKGAKGYAIQSFQAIDCIDRSMLNIKPERPEALKCFAKEAGRYVERCWVRGLEPAAATAD